MIKKKKEIYGQNNVMNCNSGTVVLNHYVPRPLLTLGLLTLGLLEVNNIYHDFINILMFVEEIDC